MKIRLDQLVVERGFAESREQAKRLILAGQIRVASQRADKPGRAFDAEAQIEMVGATLRYVSRGGLKLEAALERFALPPIPIPTDYLAIDIGTSTGGFTDCLLQHGVPRVIAIDTGRGQIHERLRTDPRVELHENTNARHIGPEEIGERLADVIVIDVSFISLRLILPAVAKLSKPGADVLALIKPQFEAGRGEVGSGGIVREAKIHQSVLRGIVTHARKEGWDIRGVMVSPLKGMEGNVEFFMHLVWPAEEKSDSELELPEALIRQINIVLQEAGRLQDK